MTGTVLVRVVRTNIEPRPITGQGDGTNLETRHEGAFLGRTANQVASRFNFNLTPKWKYNLVQPVVVPRAYVVTDVLSLPVRQLAEQESGRALQWSNILGVGDHMAYIDGINIDAYSRNSHITQDPKGVFQLCYECEP